jgi:hypothetical protein
MVLEQKIVLNRYRKSYPKNQFIFDLWPKYPGQTKDNLLILYLSVCNLKNVVTINHIFPMIDHSNTCKKTHIQYLASSFISRSNLGQNPLKVTKPSHSDLHTLYVLVFHLANFLSHFLNMCQIQQLQFYFWSR